MRLVKFYTLHWEGFYDDITGFSSGKIISFNNTKLYRYLINRKDYKKNSILEKYFL